MLNWEEYNSEEPIPAVVKTNTYAAQTEAVAATTDSYAIPEPTPLAVHEPAVVYADNAAQ